MITNTLQEMDLVEVELELEIDDWTNVCVSVNKVFFLSVCIKEFLNYVRLRVSTSCNNISFYRRIDFN